MFNFDIQFNKKLIFFAPPGVGVNEENQFLNIFQNLNPFN
jgi:hypothetical protein